MYWACCPLMITSLFRISTVSPGRATILLMSRVPLLGEENVTMSPRLGSPTCATIESDKGIFKSKARRLTKTTSPSSKFGRIEPEGIGFQSATEVRNRPKNSTNAISPRLRQIQFFMVMFSFLYMAREYQRNLGSDPTA